MPGGVEPALAYISEVLTIPEQLCILWHCAFLADIAVETKLCHLVIRNGHAPPGGGGCSAVTGWAGDAHGQVCKRVFHKAELMHKAAADTGPRRFTLRHARPERPVNVMACFDKGQHADLLWQRQSMPVSAVRIHSQSC